MENIQRPSMNLVLSTDAKPRLKWTSQLHHIFVEAVDQLGGPDKATPKGLMKAMEIPGLTLYHLKSHLQKYRLGRSQQSVETSVDDDKEEENREDLSNSSIAQEKQDPIEESSQIAEALQMQMEVEKKLHEQIEVQRHLQVRIEAQGKYLQSVLKKAQETLAGYTSSSLGLEFARAELSRLASMVTNRCSSSSFSDLTQVEDEEEEDGGCLGSKKLEETGIPMRCSVESSLTSSETSDTRLKQYETVTRRSVELPLMEIKPEAMNTKKRSQNDAVWMEQQPLGKKAFGGYEGESLRLSLSNYKKEDVEICPNLGLGLTNN